MDEDVAERVGGGVGKGVGEGVSKGVDEGVDGILSARQAKTLRKGAAIQEANKGTSQASSYAANSPRYCKKISQGKSGPVVALVLLV